MRILFVKPRLDRSELDFVLRLHRHGIFVRVMTSPGTMGRDELISEGIFVEATPYATKLSPRFALQLYRFIRDHEITLVHAPDSKSLANVLWARYFADFRVVAYRGTTSPVRRSDPSYWIGLLHPRVDRIFCVSDAVRSNLARIVAAEKLVLNYKGYELAWADESRARPVDFDLAPRGAPVALCISNARGRPHKGMPVLVEAFHRLRTTDAHLVVIGLQDPSLSKLVACGTAAARIHLLGEIPEAASWLRFADVYVQPSLSDGFPRAVKEAMAQQLAIVITAIPGLSELVVDTQSGLVVPPGDAAALADAMDRLFADPALRERLGAGARQRLAERFSAQAFFETALRAYRELHGLDDVDAPGERHSATS